jgi:glucose/mannose-6-phosphate isomerase
MAVNLDSTATRSKYDPDGMLTLIEGFVEQCKHGEELARAFKLPAIKNVQNIVICGMGGSAIGADLLKAYTVEQIPVPVEVVRNYNLPNYVGSNSLVIASSYSGNTEESLEGYAEAKKRNAKIAAVTTGGTLMDLCKKDKNPCLTIPGGISPRAATGYSFIPLLVFFERWGLIAKQDKALKALYTTLAKSIKENRYSVPTAQNKAKQLAQKLHGKLPVIYADQRHFYPIGARWRGQMNENAKHFAHDSIVPEMNHNEILGWNNPAQILKKTHVVYLLDKGIHKQTQKRFKVMKKVIGEYADGITEVNSQGSELVARMFSVINFGDFVSCYLAYLNKQDPTPIPAIDYLKKELAKK